MTRLYRQDDTGGTAVGFTTWYNCIVWQVSFLRSKFRSWKVDMLSIKHIMLLLSKCVFAKRFKVHHAYCCFIKPTFLFMLKFCLIRYIDRRYRFTTYQDARRVRLVDGLETNILRVSPVKIDGAWYNIIIYKYNDLALARSALPARKYIIRFNWRCDVISSQLGPARHNSAFRRFSCDVAAISITGCARRGIALQG